MTEIVPVVVLVVVGCAGVLCPRFDGIDAQLICPEEGRSEGHDVVVYGQEIQLSTLEREIVDSAELVPESNILLFVGCVVKLVCRRKKTR
jgi:hypothetical protein